MYVICCEEGNMSGDTVCLFGNVVLKAILQLVRKVLMLQCKLVFRVVLERLTCGACWEGSASDLKQRRVGRMYRVQG